LISKAIAEQAAQMVAKLRSPAMGRCTGSVGILGISGPETMVVRLRCEPRPVNRPLKSARRQPILLEWQHYSHGGLTMEPASRGKTKRSKTAGMTKPTQPSQADRRLAFEISTRLGLVRRALRLS
jgi:hypothetical protein